jgi:predicted nucleotidyltransferase
MKTAGLKGIFGKHGVRIAYLFGSQKDAGTIFLSGKRAEIDAASDLDVGVVFERLPECRFAVYGDLFADLSDFFSPFTVDLVFLQETEVLLQYEAIKGNCIYFRDEPFLDDYEEMTMKRAADLAFKKREFGRDFLEALKDGYFELARR